MHRKKSRKVESGRTMLEMLGVLALMGLFSIGGLKYWQYAWVRMHANDVMENLYKRTATRSGAKLTTNSFENYHHTGYGYGIRTIQEKCNKKVIPVGELEEGDRALTPRLCEALIAQITGGGVTGKHDSSGKTSSDFAAVYSYKSPSLGDCTKITSANVATFCETAVAFYVEPGNIKAKTRPVVAPISPTPSPAPAPVACARSGVDYDDCPKAQILVDGCCTDCPTGQLRVPGTATCAYCVENDNTISCCNPNTGIKKAITDCHKCDTTTGDLELDLSNHPSCQICDTSGHLQDDPACAVPNVCAADETTVKDLGGGEFEGACPKDHYIDLDEAKGDNKYCCKACPAGTHTRGNGNAQKAGGISPCETDPNNCPANKNVIDINNNCYPCEFPRSLKLANDDDCSTRFCDGAKGDGWTRFKETINGKTTCNRACEASRPLRDKDGHCHSCDTHEQVDVQGVEDNCNICDGSNDTTKHKRTLANVSTWWYWGAGNGKGSYCHFDCPKDKFLSIENSTKKCISCDDPEPHTASKESCTTCSERISNGNTCLLKSQDCEDGYTMDTSRKCTSCDQKTPFYVATEQLCTERCPQRTFHPIKQKTPRGEYVVKQYLCMLPCPPTAPLQNSDGDCFPCNDENINSGKLNKLELPCKEICENRHKVSSFCLPQCPKDTPLLERISTNTTTGSYKKYCHSCNDPTEIRTTYSDDCSVCPNRRKLVGSDGINVCVLPSQCKENEVLATDGKCYPCDSDMLDIYFGDNLSGPQQCRTCKNRRILSEHCVLRCPENKPIMIGFYQDKPITGYDQFCVSCDSSDDILTPYYSSDCSVCDGHNNTTHKKRLSSGNGRYCMICPNDSLVALDNKQCLACNDPLSIKVSSEDIQNIHKICNGSNSTTRAERTYERSNDNDSYFPYISIPCTNRPLRDQQLRCIPCDYDAAIPDTNDETLKLCPKKRYINTNASYPCKKSIAGQLSPTQCSQCGYTWSGNKCQ